MEVARVDVDRQKAAELYRAYKTHQHYQTPVDEEIQRAYGALAKGQLVIRALESIKAAGLNNGGLPRLAIGRADLAAITVNVGGQGNVEFLSDNERRMWIRGGRRTDNSARITLPVGSMGRRTEHKSGLTRLPLIPVHLRPRRALEAYHILWEAEYEPVPPGDPYLLRRIGKGDLWVVVAMWDLTAVEKGALATRITVT